MLLSDILYALVIVGKKKIVLGNTNTAHDVMIRLLPSYGHTIIIVPTNGTDILYKRR